MGDMSQLKQILEHLKVEPITAWQALKLYGCFRLAGRINDLRKKHTIKTTMIGEGNKKYAQYHLTK